MLFPGEPIALLSLGLSELTRPIPYEEARKWGSALWVMSLLDCMFDGASKAADSQMRLFLGDNYLRLQTPLHFASDDMDDASKGNIRNLKQTARELIAKEEEGAQRFLAVGQSAVEGVFKEMKWITYSYRAGRCCSGLEFADPVVEPPLHLCPQAVMICLPLLNQSPRLSLQQG